MRLKDNFSLWAAGALFFLPALTFAVKNLGQYSLLDLLVWPLTVTLAVLAISIVTLSPLIMLKRTSEIKKLTLAAGFFWFIQFHFYEIVKYDYMGPATKWVILIAILMGALYLGWTSQKKSVRLALSFFLAINIGVLAIEGGVATKRLSRDAGHFFATSNRVLPPIDSVQAKTNNVYYVIVDGMTSLNSLETHMALPVDQFRSSLQALDFHIVEKARSSYNTTHLTLTAIFFQDYFLDEFSRQYSNRTNFFPNVAYKRKLPLITNLNGLGYQIFHVGNPWAPCRVAQSEMLCLPIFASSKFVRAMIRIVNNYPFQAFAENSLLASSLRAFSRRFDFIDDDNDAIGKMVKLIGANPSLLSGPSKFFFIHHINPHPPYRKENCELLDQASYTKEALKPYKSSAICAMRRILEFAELIGKVDPSAIVVFQGDHGAGRAVYEELNSLEIRPDEERFRIANFIKAPKKCREPISPTFGNVETINLVLACLTGSRNIKYDSRSFRGFYEDSPFFGKVTEVFESN